MITCDVCGRLNDPSSATCAYCGSDLSDSPDWDTYNDDSFDDDNLNFDEADEMGYVDPNFYLNGARIPRLLQVEDELHKKGH